VKVGDALRAALRDFWHQSWRLFVLNTSLALVASAILVAAVFIRPALILLLLLGPAAAAVMHCAVTLVQTEDLRLTDAVAGLRLHWKRGLALAALIAAVTVLGFVALGVYSGAGAWAWPLAILVIYLLAVFAVLQLALWPFAVYYRTRELPNVVVDSFTAVVRRPFGFAGLALVLLLVNAAGAAILFTPLMTLTIAYSFLAAAHFALPRNTLEEATL
jgi:hypothetical protein